MRTPVIAGNWKMNTTRATGSALASSLRDAMSTLKGVEVGVAPPFPYLQTIADIVQGSGIWVAAQDMHWESSGAYTADVSAEMLKDNGCSHVILGHSERRHGWSESPQQVGRKVRCSIETGLIPIICVGETLQQREAGKTRDLILEQMQAAVEGCTEEQVARTIIAYEPVWAIGTGAVATPAQASEVHQMIRGWWAERFSTSSAESVRIQYGGSVKPDNAAELFSAEGVDGALVGGAALKAESFVGILEAAAD